MAQSLGRVEVGMKKGEQVAVRWALVSLCGLLLAGAAGCATTGGDKAGASKTPNIERARYKNLRRDGRVVYDFDLNQDGKPDQWKVEAGGRVVRVERDFNFDGIADVFLYLNSKGDVIEEEMDLDVDGVIDVVNYYRGEQIHKKEMSSDFTGLFTVVKYYDTAGKISRVERDRDGNRKVDVWEYYQDDVLVRTGRDINGDGTPDEFTEADEAQ
jgi:hypothetical protein